MARTTRKKKTEDVQELPLNAEPALETTPERKAEKLKFTENPGNDKQDAEFWAKKWLKEDRINPQPIFSYKPPKPPTPEDVAKEILATHGDINEMGNTQMLRHILWELVMARLCKTMASK